MNHRVHTGGRGAVGGRSEVYLNSAASMLGGCLQIGVLTRPHGVRGELKVRLFNEASDALSHAEDVLLVHGQTVRKVAVESVRGSAKGLILALAGVETRQDAETLKGAELWVERGQLDPLEPGEYYLVDLVGCELYLSSRLVGKITNVRPDPSVDTIVANMIDGSVAEIPIVDAWIGAVDIERGRVELLSEDGIITG